MKRLLSIILAIAMIAAMLPNVFAAETTDTTEPLVYKFCRGSYGSDTDIDDARKVATYNEVTATDTAKFRMVATTNMPVKKFTESSFEYEIYNYKIQNSVSILGFGLVVDKAGAMKTSVTYQPNAGSYTAEVYLVKNADTITAEDMAKNTAAPSTLAGYQKENYDTNTTVPAHWKGVIAGENVQRLGSVNMQEGEGETTVFLENVMVTSGEYYLIFTYNTSTSAATTCKTYLNSFTLTPLPEDTALTEAFKVKKEENYSYTAKTMTGLTIGGKVINADPNADGSYNIEAPATNDKNKPFLYWAKGMETRKKIISFSNKLVNYVPENNGNNFIIAVYEGDITDATTPEYYNRDGQLIAKSPEEPEYPSIPGLGTAIAWEDCGGNIKVAKYEDMERDNVTVTAVDGKVNSGETTTVAYGTEVTCTADETKGTFKCWTKSKIHGATEDEPEIVSVYETYKFNAWEDCTVTAVYEVHNYTGNTMKIIIDTFTAGSETGVMAEFIGLDSAVEKGIMFTDSNEKKTKIAMTTKDNQFTVIADGTGTYEGYAIVKEEDSSYTLITDGSYEHTK